MTPHLGAYPTLPILLRQTTHQHLRRSRPRNILNVFQRIRFRFFMACGLASAGASFVSSRTAMSDRLLALMLFLCSVVFLFAGIATSVSAEPSETLTIAAANSLREALRNVLPLFEAQHPNFNVRVVYGPSQTLRDQITQGAPVDVFLPSIFEEIEQLEKKGLIIQGTKRIYAGTSLVLITGAILPAPIKSIEDMRTVPVRRIAIGDPKTSSVGKVAIQFLKYSKLEPALKSQYVFGEHSRAVLDLVAKGEAEIGVVYRTDAITEDRVRILDTAPAGSHSPVRYGIAVVWAAKNISGAGDFIQFLLSVPIQAQLKQYGFDQAIADVGYARRQEVKP